MTKEEFDFKLYHSKNIEFKLLFQIMKENLSILGFTTIFLVLFSILYTLIDLGFSILNSILPNPIEISFGILPIYYLSGILNKLILFLILFPILCPIFDIVYNLFKKYPKSNINYLNQIKTYYKLNFKYIKSLFKMKNKKLSMFNPLLLFLLPITILENPNIKNEDLVLFTMFKSQNILPKIFGEILKITAFIIVFYFISFFILFGLFYATGFSSTFVWIFSLDLLFSFFIFSTLFLNLIIQTFRIYNTTDTIFTQ